MYLLHSASVIVPIFQVVFLMNISLIPKSLKLFGMFLIGFGKTKVELLLARPFGSAIETSHYQSPS